MSIQFACPGCQQPIEVDDEHAGRKAACPYCQSVVTVPTESTYQHEPVTAARPSVGQPTMPSAYQYGVPQANEAALAQARTTGNWALVATALLVISFVAMFSVLAKEAAPAMNAIAQSQPTTDPAAMDEASKEMQAAMMKAMQKPMVLILSIVATLIALGGTVLSIVSIAQGRILHWRAVLALILCGGYTLCTGIGFLSQLLMR